MGWGPGFWGGSLTAFRGVNPPLKGGPGGETRGKKDGEFWEKNLDNFSPGPERKKVFFNPKKKPPQENGFLGGWAPGIFLEKQYRGPPGFFLKS